jgi:hypothetical protein
VFQRNNIYEIKRRIGKQGFLCKLDLNDKNWNEPDIVRGLAEKESEIVTKCWELYHKKVII